MAVLPADAGAWRSAATSISIDASACRWLSFSMLFMGSCLESVELFFPVGSVLATKPSMPASLRPNPWITQERDDPGAAPAEAQAWSRGRHAGLKALLRARRSVHPAPSCRDQGPHAWSSDIGTDLIKGAYSPSAVGALSERETCLVISER